MRYDIQHLQEGIPIIHYLLYHFKKIFCCYNVMLALVTDISFTSTNLLVVHAVYYSAIEVVRMT